MVKNTRDGEGSHWSDLLSFLRIPQALIKFQRVIQTLWKLFLATQTLWPQAKSHGGHMQEFQQSTSESIFDCPVILLEFDTVESKEH